MRTVDDFARIRQLHREGLSARQIARQLGIVRDPFRKALQNPEPIPYTQAVPRTAPVFGPFRAVVNAIVAPDETAPPKQRHTASQIYRPLVTEHNYRGPYDQVRRAGQSQDVHSARSSAGGIAAKPTSATFTSTSPTTADFCRR